MNDYAKDYDKKVLNGRQIACKWIKKACQIDLECRKRSRNSNYPYYYNRKLASRFVNLAQLISPKRLALFQKWYISILFGYRFKTNNMRRYNSSILSMARKNAKSYLASIILLSMMLDDELNGRMNRQYYIASSKLQQSELTLNQARSAMKRLQVNSPLTRNFKLNRDKIYSTVTGNYLQALTSRPESLDGLNPSGIDLDEAHAIKDPRLLEVLESAMGQTNGLIIQSSTTGFINCPFKDDWKVAENELKNGKTNSRSFNALFTQDNKKEIYNDPKFWIKSNPLLNKVPQMKLYLKDQLNKALVNGRSNSVLVKNFNKWGSVNDNAFISPDKYKSNMVKPIDLMNRKNVVIGLDLSRVRDLTSVTFTVPLNNNKYYSDTFSFVADRGGIEQKSKQDNINYKALQQANLVHICKHSYGLIDYKLVVHYITDLINKYHWKNVILAYDPWQAGTVVQMLGQNSNITLVKVSQSIANLTNTIQWLYRLMVSHKLLMNKNNVLFKYAFNNLEATFDIHGNEYLRKTRNSDKIDPVFALVDSLFVQKNLKQNNNKPSLSEELKHNDFTF